MKIIGQYQQYYLFAPLKKEEAGTAIDKVSDIMQTDFNYVCITSPEDHRINGYIDAINGIASSFEWKKYNLIIATKP